MRQAEQMTVADMVREFCTKEFIQPARDRNDLAVGIRAGDVHERMQMSQRLPAVCSALGSDRFEREARLRRVAIEGPLNGASTLFVYRLL